MANGGKVLLTAGRVEKFTCPEGKVSAFLWDSDVKGLGLKASAGGSKQYVLETRLLNGKTARLTIGKPSVWSLDAARVEARRLQVLIDQGIDPREQEREKAEAKAAAKAAAEAAKRAAEQRKKYTLHALCMAYADHLKTKGKDKTATDVRSAFRVHVVEAHPDIASTPAREVTSHQIAALVRKVRESGKLRTAGILRNYLVAAFNAARKAPFDSGISSDLIQFEITTNPAEIIPAIAVNKGERNLTPDELRTYLEALGDDGAGQALRVALFAGGQRMAQLLRAKVSDYDPVTSTLRLWDGKGKRQTAREHLLPLGPMAVTVIERLITTQAKADESLFGVSERTVGNRVSSISDAMPGAAFDLRDIRRTCETMLAGMGVSKDIRAQLLSHGISGVQSQHYDRHDYWQEKRAALLAWEARIEEIQTGIPRNNVIPLRA